jgi:hypothetical protein
MWQPIKTAPKDRTIMLVRKGYWPMLAKWNENYVYWEENCTNEDGEDFTRMLHPDEYQPTHWMDIPPFDEELDIF